MPKGVTMPAAAVQTDRSGVDKSLVAMFLEMSPEERVKANDNAVRAILELRNAFRQKQNKAFIEERKTYQDLLKDAIEIEFRGHTVRVLDLKVLAALKRTFRLPHEQQRLAVLEETLRQLSEKRKTPALEPR